MNLSMLGPIMANHLWQSTEFVTLVWLTTLFLRRNPARIRYSLWLAASLKFLLPFSLLIELGSLLPRPHRSVTPAAYSVIDLAEQPFSRLSLPILADASKPNPSGRLASAVPAALASIWLGGAVLVFAVWCWRWHHLSRMLRKATLAEDGREFSLLHSEERFAGHRPVPLRLSRETVEPGVFGIFNPVLVWPAHISKRLDDEHIRAILAHELTHIQRRDNLFAALHMLVSSVFWFHPLVWWIERRMVEERELACDEAVLAAGTAPALYADSLLKALRFCVELPLPCVSGITGADLNRRVRSIMSLRLQPLSLGKKIALSGLIFFTVAAPVTFGIVRMIPLFGQVLHATGPSPSFEVATIKPSKESPAGSETNGEQTHFIVTAKLLIQMAYGLSGGGLRSTDLQVIGGPDWIVSDAYDILAKVDAATFARMQAMGRAQRGVQRQLMEQALLTDRMKLAVHTEMRDQPVYALTVAHGGSKLKAVPGVAGAALVKISPGGDSISPEEFHKGILVSSNGRGYEMIVKGMTLDSFVHALATYPELQGRMVVDQTHLTGAFDFKLDWAPEQTASTDGTEPSDAESFSPLFTAIQQQLGLKLVQSKGPAEAIVVDHIERPSEN